MWPKISGVPEHHVVKEGRMLRSRSRVTLPRDRAMLVSELDRKGFLLAFDLADPVMARLSLTPGTTSKLSGVSVPFGLHLLPWKIQVAGPVPTCYGTRGGPHVRRPWGCSGEGCGCRGLPWLQALASSSLWFVTTAQGDAPQSSRAKVLGF